MSNLVSDGKILAVALLLLVIQMGPVFYRLTVAAAVTIKRRFTRGPVVSKGA